MVGAVGPEGDGGVVGRVGSIFGLISVLSYMSSVTSSVLLSKDDVRVGADLPEDGVSYYEVPQNIDDQLLSTVVNGHHCPC